MSECWEFGPNGELREHCVIELPVTRIVSVPRLRLVETVEDVSWDDAA
jgi:hypothetical protein